MDQGPATATLNVHPFVDMSRDGKACAVGAALQPGSSSRYVAKVGRGRDGFLAYSLDCMLVNITTKALTPCSTLPLLRKVTTEALAHKRFWSILRLTSR